MDQEKQPEHFQFSTFGTFYEELMKLLRTELPAPVSKRLYPIYGLAKKQMLDIENMKIDIATKHGTLNAERTGFLFKDNDSKMAFNTEYVNYLTSNRIQFDIPKIKISELENVRISPETLFVLAGVVFIDD